MQELGLATFKSWPTAFFWFYPTYGRRLSRAEVNGLVRSAKAKRPGLSAAWLRSALDGSAEAARDLDVVRLAWNQDRWPYDLEGHGESRVGNPVQHYNLTQSSDIGWGKPYLNYLLCLSALSQHVSSPPTSFLELGGGFGVLGEIVMSRDPRARYVNLDIPPLVAVSSYYLTELFGENRVLTYDERVADTGPVEVPESACLPNWRLPDIEGPFDVFVNTFSFQEMEPHVVEHYIHNITSLGLTYVVSLNSRKGKQRATETNEVGVVDPVTSQTVIEMFEQCGYRLCGRYNRPLIISAGEIAVLEKI